MGRQATNNITRSYRLSKPVVREIDRRWQKEGQKSHNVDRILRDALLIPEDDPARRHFLERIEETRAEMRRLAHREREIAAKQEVLRIQLASLHAALKKKREVSRK